MASQRTDIRERYGICVIVALRLVSCETSGPLFHRWLFCLCQLLVVWKGWGGKYRMRSNGTQFGILDRTINNHLSKRPQEGEVHSVCIELDDGFFENVKSFLCGMHPERSGSYHGGSLGN